MTYSMPTCESLTTNPMTDNMSTCESLHSKLNFDGSSRGFPRNAGFEFVIRNHMEDPSYVAIGIIG